MKFKNHINPATPKIRYDSTLVSEAIRGASESNLIEEKYGVVL